MNFCFFTKLLQPTHSIFILFLCTLFSTQTGAKTSPSFEVLIDEDNVVSIDHILNNEVNFENGKPSYGFSDATFWVRIDVRNYNHGTHFIELNYPHLDNITAYFITSSNMDSVNLGDNYPFGQRPIENTGFQLDIPEGTQYTLFKINSSSDIVFPISIIPASELMNYNLTRYLIFGIYYGILIIMFFYNLVLSYSLKEKNYLIYSCTILFTFFFMMAYNGHGYQFLWSDSPNWNHRSISTFLCLSAVFIVLFVQHFLNLKEEQKRLNKLFHAFNILNLISFFYCVFYPNNIVYGPILGLISLQVPFSIVAGIIAWRRGNSTAKYFVFAWVIYQIGGFMAMTKTMGLIPSNFLTNYSVYIGSTLEIFLLSFALSDKYRKMEEESVTLLESKVKERTYELRKSQSQLVNAEKMASIGQLTAGIAHEINNPINFVSSNITPLSQDIKDVLELIKLYKAFEEGNATVEDIRLFKEDIDFEYVKDEINELLSGIREGATRTSEIVQGLKNFSRLDRNDLSKTNLNNCVQDTLLILKSQTKEIEIQKDLNDIPTVECFAGKINQVVMNLLLNAIDAVELKDSNNGKIIISTKALETGVQLSIQDNGIGIPENQIKDVLDPFFTTKEVGKGTGLGLSISQGIINDHNGSLAIASQYGEGTTVTITLPFEPELIDS